MQPQQGYAPQQPAYPPAGYAQPGVQQGYAQAPGQAVAGYAVQQPQQPAARPVLAQQAPQQLQGGYSAQPLQATGAARLGQSVRTHAWVLTQC